MPSNTPHNQHYSPLNPPIPEKTEEVVWRQLTGCSDSLALAAAVNRQNGLFVIVTADSKAALRLEHELEFFLGKQSPVLHFPDWETLPYDLFSPLPEIISQRLKTLSSLPQIKRGVLVVSIATFMQKLAPREHILANSLVLERGDTLVLEETRQRLEQVGYQCVGQVFQHGEFAIRGSIIDLFPMGSSVPYRIELFDDEVETIRTFDVDTQRSLEKVDRIELFPAREFPFTDESIKLFRRSFRSHFPEIAGRAPIYQDVSRSITPAGIEYYLPLFVDKTETLLDYLPGQTTLVFMDAAQSRATEFFHEVQDRFEQRKESWDRPVLAPDALYLPPDELIDRIDPFALVHIPAPDSESSQTVGTPALFATRPLPDVSLRPGLKRPTHALETFLNEGSGRVLFVAETTGHREALLETLHKQGIRPHPVDSWNDFINTDESPCIVVAPMDHGLWLDDPAIVIITESQITGERAQQRRRRRKAASQELENVVNNLTELTIGAPVVHRDHGVGRYQGLQKLQVGDLETEFLTLQYANNDKLYVPVASIQLISRYTGASPETAPLHKLGSDRWNKARRKAMERVRDVAAELLDVQAKRAAKQGYAFSTNSEDYEAFALAFPFEETPDQLTAIQDVIADMHSEQPMDRVICGDVGFGKTEVALRAAFIAAENDKQVAVLVPTTLLAQQHFQTFRDRFADTPIRVEVLSRFVTKKQQEQVLQAVADGAVDLLIGTHKLLQKGIRYKNLGLVIIDEEHRFGVRHKEHFKKLRSELDLLTLTATPIPRTLNMAMAGLRDISIIASPPPNRHAIKTFVTEWTDALIQEACLREIKRGGQVFFLHNTVKTIDRMAEELAELVPDARIEIAHGQMPERELERIMLDFYHQRSSVLVCTTIIESGIDIPSANTIIINRADKLGLAQLHQLRGRVGRSHHRAYAYLLIPSKNLMTSDAAKRLQAIEASGELGTGFMLSSHDLEIRGAGELLGEEQSGQIQEIGFTLYMELLERAVSALKSGRHPELEAPLETGPEVDLQAASLIPDDYLPDVHARLVFYKRIANATDEAALRDLQVEMIDRFGLLPEATKNLFAITRLKLYAGAMGIRKIEAGEDGGRIVFTPEPDIDPTKLIQLIQKQPNCYRLDGPEKLSFSKTLDTTEDKTAFLHQLLDALSDKAEPATTAPPG